VINSEAIESGSTKVALGPSPINAGWVLEGNPIARNKLVSTSADGTASTYLWDCTSGRFNWHYDIDETVYLIEGAVSIKDTAGKTREVSAGEWIFFPAGSSAEWKVDTYVRKFAFLRSPQPKSVVFARRVYRKLRRLLGDSSSTEPVPAMFQNN
jgi:uncharacterized cupin superfamily protein